MDESFDTFSPNHSQPGSPQAAPSRPSGSGLILVLPALKGGKPVKSGKKSKQRFGSQPFSAVQDGDMQEKRITRPAKLKPLKEVLAKLIAQIKRKDDYAFFLQPVDSSKVQGYSDIVKRPMDLGTMTTKVNRGRYRSLEEFANDLRLVTSNAKLFNPPGTIYHTEADRIEAWGLDHISKAASTVIQYETDWNIDVERDDDGHNVNIDDEDDYNVNTPMDVEEPGPGGRSPSVASQVQPGATRRGARGPYKKTANTASVSETIDAEGRLPGSKDGLGAFPPGSDWARTMLALKLKGKRYRTKKERLRIEKEGPPLLPEGSLDYTEMEDPFSVLSVLAPEPVSRPYVTPLYPPISLPAQPRYDPSTSQPQPAPFPTPINLPSGHQPPIISGPGPGGASNKRRHWAIIRNAPTRSKGKEKDDESETADAPTWQAPREAHAVDFGSFALLAGELAEEMRRRGVQSSGEEQEQVFGAIRDSLDCEAVARAPEGVGASDGGAGYWSKQRAAEAEEYVRDLVYGGVDGLAYVRSLAEFVRSGPQEGSTSPPNKALGMPLAKWVEQHIVDSLTEGRHSLIRETASQLAVQSSAAGISQFETPKGQQELATQVSASLHLYPSATLALSALLQIRTHKIDMGALIKTPEELFLSEEEWAGKIFKEKRRLLKREDGKAQAAQDDGMEVEEPERTWMDVDASLGTGAGEGGHGQDNEYELEGPAELNVVLDYVAGVIVNLDRRIRGQVGVTNGLSTKRGPDVGLLGAPNGEVKREENAGPDQSPPAPAGADEDPTLRNLRLNLLALAKRAPLDTIARLPKDLVPEHIRHFVPTLGTTT